MGSYGQRGIPSPVYEAYLALTARNGNNGPFSLLTFNTLAILTLPMAQSGPVPAKWAIMAIMDEKRVPSWLRGLDK